MELLKWAWKYREPPDFLEPNGSEYSTWSNSRLLELQWEKTKDKQTLTPASSGEEVCRHYFQWGWKSLLSHYQPEQVPSPGVGKIGELNSNPKFSNGEFRGFGLVEWVTPSIQFCLLNTDYSLNFRFPSPLPARYSHLNIHQHFHFNTFKVKRSLTHKGVLANGTIRRGIRLWGQITGVPILAVPHDPVTEHIL